MQLSHIGFAVVGGPWGGWAAPFYFSGIAIKPSYPYLVPLKLLVFNLNAGHL